MIGRALHECVYITAQPLKIVNVEVSPKNIQYAYCVLENGAHMWNMCLERPVGKIHGHQRNRHTHYAYSDRSPFCDAFLIKISGKFT